MKRQRVQRCFLCEKSHLECDGGRPCVRCITTNNASLCIASARATHGGSQDVSQGFRSSGNEAQIPKVSPEVISSPSIQQAPNSPTHHSTLSQPMKITAHTANEVIAASADLLKAAEKTINSAQIDINSFLLEEIQLLKEDQKRLYDEILALKMDNMRLSSALDTKKPVPAVNRNGDRSKGMVLFDLMKNPAIVLTANDTFCDMLGYEMKEVLGMPWHKFIHKDYIERTLSILSQRSAQDASTTFEQVYKHKDEGIFAALDTHKIFFANGEPVSDLVYIELTGSSTKLPSPNSRPRLVQQTQPQLEKPVIPALTNMDTLLIKQEDDFPMSSPLEQPMNSESSVQFDNVFDVNSLLEGDYLVE